MTDQLTPDDLRKLAAEHDRLRIEHAAARWPHVVAGLALDLAEKLLNAYPVSPPWRELADRVGESERTYRDLSQRAWEQLNIIDAIRFRGMAEGLATAQDHRLAVLAELQPDPPQSTWIRPTSPPSMAVEVRHPPGAWCRLAVAPAEVDRHRVDRVVYQDTADDWMMDTGLRIIQGPGVSSPAQANPPALREGQTHLGTIFVGKRVTAIHNRNIDVDRSGSEGFDG
jgi:hypothetical protein